MKNKKLLLILLAVLAVIIVLVIVLVSVFAVRNVELVYYDYKGDRIPKPDDGIDKNEVLKSVQGQSTVVLSKDKLKQQLNAAFTDWHTVEIVKVFPNTLEIHLAERRVMAKIDIGGSAVYVDSFGYVMETDNVPALLDITSAFAVREAVSTANGHKLQFTDEQSNARLVQVFNAISAMWRAKIEYEQIPSFFGEKGVFEFDGDGSFVINTLQGAKIVVKSPQTNLEEGLIKAFSVYTDPKQNLQQPGVVITVTEDGRISSNSSNR